MNAIDRRRFMQLAGGTAALSALSTSIARAAEIPAHRRTGSIKDIEHVVVLMQENRSFDHYLGTLRGVRGFGDPHPVTLPSGKPVWYQSDGTKEILPFHPDAKDLGLAFLEDLPHGWNDTQAAFNKGTYDKWIPAKSATTMAHLTREDIPFHYALADAFTVCDAYHCSFMGSTDPNRYYMWTGYTGNDGKGGGPVLGNDEAGYSWTTYPERLEKADVSWKIYQDIGDGLDADGGWGWIGDAYRGNYGDNSLLYFDQYRNAKPGDPLYDKARTGTDARKGEGFFDILRADVKVGKLPEVSWIVAPEAFTEHPNWPANYGAWYISQVLDALTSNPDVWSKTALFITYDENDGFFDHVPPPVPGPDDPDEWWEGHPTGLGIRVPMLVISPWSTGGHVCSELFDHTSVNRFLERWTGVEDPNVSPWRRTVTGDLTAAFAFDPEPAPAAVPPGTRPARALPYQPDAHAVVRGEQVAVTLVNTGASSAHFALYPYAGEFAAPQHWDVRGEAQWTVPLTADHYRFTVTGPNGFRREFTGTPSDGVEVASAVEAPARELRLTLTNTSARPQTATVRPQARERDPHPACLRLAPGETRTLTHPTSAAHGWYDLVVTVAGDPAFSRRLAGHIEDGRPSVTG